MRTRLLVGGVLLGLTLSACARDWDSFEFTEGDDAGAGGSDAQQEPQPDASDAGAAGSDASTDAAHDASETGSDAAEDAVVDADASDDVSEAGEDASLDVAEAGEDVVADAAADVTLDASEAGDAPLDVAIDNDSSAPADASDAQQDVVTEEAGCAVDEKSCLGTCVPLDDPATGCGAVACWACPTPAHAVAACSATYECTVGACQSPWKNCNAEASDGCESNTSIDVDNCGGCGNTCAFPHAGATCQSGSCAMGSCEIGFSDCDGDALNGCEANLKLDPLNCAACGNVCPGGTLATCSNGICGLSSCPVGTANCDGQASNGCEINTTSDPDHCGACGNACEFTNAEPNCVGSACVIAWCTGGFGNCDKNAANGCEVNLASSTSNCGTCGKVCSSVGGQASCAAGTCQIACTGSHADCDIDVATGCEADLFTSMQNCGACGTACPATAAHATGTCDRECLLTCASGWADCDRNVATGCESPAKDYSATVLADSPVGYWRLGEKSGSVGADKSGHGSTLTYVNSPLLGRPGAPPCDPDTSIRFESVQASHALLARNATVDPKSTGLTVEYWVKEESPLKAGPGHLWYGDGNDISASGACWGFRRDPVDSNKLAGSVKTSAGGVTLGCTNCVKLGAWYHVAITYDNAKVTLWINGVNKVEYPLAGTLKCTGSYGLRVGGSNLPGDYLDALVDEVAIYDKPLSAARLLAHYQAGI